MGTTVLSSDQAHDLADVFQALSAPTRVRILAHLAAGPQSVSALVDELAIPQATLSNHLRVLRNARLVVGDRTGRVVTYRLADGHVATFFQQALSHLGHA